MSLIRGLAWLRTFYPGSFSARFLFESPNGSDHRDLKMDLTQQFSPNLFRTLGKKETEKQHPLLLTRTHIPPPPKKILNNRVIHSCKHTRAQAQAHMQTQPAQKAPPPPTLLIEYAHKHIHETI